MTTPAKLYGRELSTYDEVDVDELLSKLSQEELTMLAKEVDPDVSTLLISLTVALVNNCLIFKALQFVISFALRIMYR